MHNPNSNYDFVQRCEDHEVARARPTTTPVFKTERAGLYGRDGTITLTLRDEEFMRFESTGEVFVRGQLIDDDEKVYGSFREWLSIANPGKL